MVAQQTHTLISYNDSKTSSGERDFYIASQLAKYLHNQNVVVEVKGYSESILQDATYQWLILIYSPEAVKSQQIDSTVNKSLKQVVERRMRGILAVTASPSDLPDKWSTIRTYDASNQEEESRVLENVWRAMQYVKVPYAEAQQTSSQQKPVLSRGLKIIAAIEILTIVFYLGIFIYPYLPYLPHPHPTLTSTELTATAQTHQHAQPTATNKTTPIPTLSPQQQYNNIIRKQTPTFTGFQDSQQWDTTNITSTSCTLDNTKTYHAKITLANSYVMCMAKNTNFTNFAYQVAMNIQGDAGGLIFRNESAEDYYRVALSHSSDQNNSPGKDKYTVAVYFCDPLQCTTTNSVGQGTSLYSSNVHVAQNQPIVLTVIAQGSNIDLYINGNFLDRVNDGQTIPLSGQIGVYAASFSNNTDVTFSNLKVWVLDSNRQGQNRER